MKLIYISDLHIDSGPLGRSAARLLPEVIIEAAPDVFVIGGDIASKLSTIDHTMASFRDLACRKLYVPGNHDIWVNSVKEKENGITSREKYRSLIPDICSNNDFHYLPGNPLVIEGIGFAGTIGWYDYSLRNPKFDDILSEMVYRRKHYKGRVWNDRRYAKWEAPDPDVSREMTEELDRDLSAVEGKSDAVIAITHHVPFIELVRRTGDPNWDYFNAFMGSVGLGETLLRHPKVVLSLSGHTHFRQDRIINGIRAITAPLGYTHERSHDHAKVVRDSMFILNVPQSPLA